MPKFTLLLGRRTMQVYDIEQSTIRVGREEGLEIIIDNASVSRKQCQFRQAEGGAWVVEDMGSSNGTFVNGDRIEGATPVSEGDEVGIGKFGLLFGKAVGEASGTQVTSAPIDGGTHGTMQIKTHELEQMLAASSKERRAHLDWEAGGQKGRHSLADQPGVVIGTDVICDVRVPKGPKHHLLVMRIGENTEVRNLANWAKMKVNGSVSRKARLKNGDVIEMAGCKVTFQDEVGGG